MIETIIILFTISTILGVHLIRTNDQLNDAKDKIKLLKETQAELLKHIEDENK